MNPPRLPVTEDTKPSPSNPSRRQRFKFKEFPAPSRAQSDARCQAMKRCGSGELDPRGCASAEMEDLPRIILVSGEDTLMPELNRVLDPCPLEIRTLKGYLEAANEIGRCSIPNVIFTDVHLPDGDWKQVLQMASQAPARTEVILVSRYVDVRLYLDALEAGAFDFIVPPFHTVELGYIVVNAIYACFKQSAHAFSGHFSDATAL